jgi:hypothetical protein
MEELSAPRPQAGRRDVLVFALCELVEGSMPRLDFGANRLKRQAKQFFEKNCDSA